ncbi:MAG TPA: YhjD/YihY/BrkB family envelope integrity protein [Nitrospiraceae bacterium]|nr:YhjD/YihY/BrkB family envelope integrity protein [Nitrospiraceae bacterium]
MGKPARLEQFLKQDLWTMDVGSLRGPRRLGVQLLRLIWAAATEFSNRLLDARAAGLVYTTLLSLVPFLAVTFSVLKAFGVHQLIEPVLGQILEPLGEKGADITAQVIGFVSNIQVGVLGVVGIAGLIYTTYSLIDKIETTFNAIWRVRQGRSWGRKFTDYMSVVLLGPVLVMTAFGLLASVQSNALVQRVLELQPFGYVAVWAAQLMPFVILSALFSFLYKFVPNTTVRVTSAVVGGITAAILWGIAGQVFAAFVVESAKYSAIYSGFAILILFLLWLYIGWVVILVGAQVAFFHQHPAAYHTQFLWAYSTHGFRERLALTLLVHITRRFLEGAPPSQPPELATELNMPLSVVEDQIDELIGHGMLCRMMDPEGIGLVKPPELIPITDILQAIRYGQDPGKGVRHGLADEVERLLHCRDRAVNDALAGITLRSLVLDARHEPHQSQESAAQAS